MWLAQRLEMLDLGRVYGSGRLYSCLYEALARVYRLKGDTELFCRYSTVFSLRTLRSSPSPIRGISNFSAFL